ncbi:DNRLRE domain-containing protein [Sungkyunkwania multivorans]|uniref:DNRLRE domain-containing protein n=1 Tax=Sungkyunkwania multivorans TaxID=1173618 RepID=A0ABW3CX63_9FLAO
MKKIFTFLFSAIGIAGFSQTTIDINPSRYNTLYESATGNLSNGAGSYFFAGNTLQADAINTRRGLLYFDLSAIPAGATVTAATLTLNMNQTRADAENVSLHSVTSDWGSGTSDAGGGEGDGTGATTNDATWIHSFFSTSTWASPGGDFNPTPSATTTVDGVGMYSWSSAGLVSDLNAWITTPANNFGWIFIGNESTDRTAKRFEATGTNQPVLSVTYTTLGIVENTFGKKLNYYQSNGNTTVFMLNESYDNITLTARNLMGQVVLTNDYLNQREIEFTLNSPNGIYLLEVASDTGERAVIKVAISQ